MVVVAWSRVLANGDCWGPGFNSRLHKKCFSASLSLDVGNFFSSISLSIIRFFLYSLRVSQLSSSFRLLLELLLYKVNKWSLCLCSLSSSLDPSYQCETDALCVFWMWKKYLKDYKFGAPLDIDDNRGHWWQPAAFWIFLFSKTRYFSSELHVAI